MKDRIYIKDLTKHVGDTVEINGFLETIRAQSKIAFLILRDISGRVQLVITAENPLFQHIENLTTESVLSVNGVVKDVPQAPGGIEVEPTDLEILSKADPELPIPVVFKKGGEETEAPVRFDYRWLDLRKDDKSRIFKVWTELEKGFRKYFDEKKFIQLYPPSFMNTASETGAEVFEVKYFDKKAYLAQSPQFYKQMGIASGFEKVFMMGPVFRAEESFTTRHLTEFTGWDFEVGYVESHNDVMDIEEEMLVTAIAYLKEEMPDIDIEVPARPFPRIKIEEVKKILKERGVESHEEHDISPEEERGLALYVKEKYDHDFVFVTEYHKSKSAFYHMRLDEGSDRSRRADLLFRGIEITTLAQREHRPEVLIKQAEEKQMDLESLKDYINFFRYGCPPHGGGGIGPGRLIMKLLDLPNVREATYLPRDVKRLNP